MGNIATGPSLALATATKATNIRWRIFGLFFILAVVNLIDRTALSIGMPTIAKEFGLSPAMQGLILSSFFWSYAALQLPGGWLLDRLGARLVVGISTILWALFQGVTGLATGAGTLIVARLGLGAAEAPLFPAGGKLNAAWLAPSERGRGATLMDCGAPVGAAFGGLIISSLIAFLDSWRLAFIVAGVGTLLIGLVAFYFLRDDPAAHPRVNAAELDRIAAAGEASGATTENRTLSARSFTGLVLGRSAWAMMNFGLLTWGPSYLAQARGLDLKTMGMATFGIFLAGAVGEFLGGVLADALQRRGVGRGVALKSMLAVSGLIVCATFLALPEVGSAALAVALLAVTLFFLLWGGLYWSFPALLAPRERAGFVGSIMNFAGSASGIAVPLLAGFILQMTASYTLVLYYFAGCALLYVVGSLLIEFEAKR